MRDVSPDGRFTPIPLWLAIERAQARDGCRCVRSHDRTQTWRWRDLDCPHHVDPVKE